MILETKRLYLREMTRKDFPALCKILRDEDVMYAYAHAFSEAEARRWLDRQLRRYAEDGFGLWAAVLKETDEMIGQCGLAYQDWDGTRVLEIGYLFQKAYWGRGYATEAAARCKQYAFGVLRARQVYSIIRDTNIPSRKVAERNGMIPCGKTVKYYFGEYMPHIVYAAKKSGDE